MKSGIIGARGVGKSTVFHAFTGLAPLAGQGDAKNRARPGQIKVSDLAPRLSRSHLRLEEKNPRRIDRSRLRPGPEEQKEGAALDPRLLPLIRDLDALLIVIPGFHRTRSSGPRRD